MTKGEQKIGVAGSIEAKAPHDAEETARGGDGGGGRIWENKPCKETTFISGGGCILKWSELGKKRMSTILRVKNGGPAPNVTNAYF